jgi:ribosomal protein L37E
VSRRLNIVPPFQGQKGVCAWCGGELTGRRRSWCSDACVDEYRIRAWPGFARKKVFERDGGVCALCGFDTEAAQHYAWQAHLGFYGAEARLEVRARVRALGLPWLPRSWWEADHIVPVCEGGAELGLDNLRTLCVPCHRRETADLNRRRALA